MDHDVFHRTEFLANWKPEISRVCTAATVETLIELQRLLFGFQLNRRHQLRVIVARCRAVRL